ncbi:MAG: hypothetical protein MI924_12380 [Chloroflexales bacterium]|nr:hypothetical protein [Chloroflexales bacterium]
MTLAPSDGVAAAPPQRRGAGPLNPQELNRSSYVNTNPVRSTDSTGHVSDTLVDVAFIVADVVDSAQNGYTTEKVVDAHKVADKAADTVKTTKQTTRHTPKHASTKSTSTGGCSFTLDTPLPRRTAPSPSARSRSAIRCWPITMLSILALPNYGMHLDRADPRRQHSDRHARPLLLRAAARLGPPPGRHAVGRPPGQQHPRDDAGLLTPASAIMPTAKTPTAIESTVSIVRVLLLNRSLMTLRQRGFIPITVFAYADPDHTAQGGFA